jgi:glycine cleavage system H protein
MYVIPKNLKYSDDHAWVLLQGDIAVVGLTAYIKEDVGGQLDIIEMQEEGFQQRLKELIIIKSVRGRLRSCSSPLTGSVVEINRQVEDNPDLFNNDPYGEGWICKIRYSERSELRSLLDHSAYSKLINGG